MRSYLGYILLISAAAAVDISTTTKPEQRNKRQLITSSLGIPIYYDNFNANPGLEPVQPLQPVQPLPPLQPITVVSPVVSNTAGVQTPGFLPAFAQNLPIVGPLLANLQLQSLLGGLGLNLGNSGQPGALGNLGNLGNLGQLGNLANLGGQKPPGGSTPQTCPITQKLTCRCDPLLPLQLRESESHLIKIIKQNIRHNDDGSRELRLVISNGVILYHRNEKDAIKQQGYYALPFQKEHYLNVHYSINKTNYTVKADIGNSPPKSDFDSWTPSQLDIF
ncbi:uncharacterized protein LOC117790201 [Drosophila innubila]|uniref:uncharacterized protein LOC117790201 n=1 Tax=Drosophila innubila TaxID=198719 RepID=UPI00148C99BB|nr:uncharacterized protein LOC117790201 [Drosophila innubila]